jgi:hypothetical protein
MSSQELRAEVIAWPQLTPSHIAEWQALVASVAAAPDLEYGWARTLIRAHEIDPGEVHCLALRAGASLAAWWPMRVHRSTRRKLPVTIVEPLVSVYALHQGLLHSLELGRAQRELLAAMEATWPHWTVLRLCQLEQGGELARWWHEHAATAGWHAVSALGVSPPYLPISSGWDDYLKTKSANFRSNLKRKPRKLAEHAPYRIEFIDDESSMRDALAAVAAIEAHSWKAGAGTAIVSRPWEQRFYEELAANFAPSQQLLITLLRLADEPVAYDLTILGGGRGYCLKTSFDSRHADLSPGLVLRAELMRRMFDGKLREYDFLGNNERYKLEWTDQVRRDETLELINRRSFVGKLVAWSSAG